MAQLLDFLELIFKKEREEAKENKEKVCESRMKVKELLLA